MLTQVTLQVYLNVYTTGVSYLNFLLVSLFSLFSARIYIYFILSVKIFDDFKQREQT